MTIPCVNTDRLASLVDALSALVECQSASVTAAARTATASLRALHADTSDPRLRGLLSQLQGIETAVADLARTCRDDLVVKMRQEVAALGDDLPPVRAAQMLLDLLRVDLPSPAAAAERLLEAAVEAVAAERGFIVSCVSESTEAYVVAAKAFQSRNLAEAEYRFSRSLVRRVVETGKPLLIPDASQDPAYSNLASVHALGLRSVVVVPLRVGGSIVGVLYLEDRRRPQAFGATELRLLETVARLQALWLWQSRLQAWRRDPGVLLDTSRAMGQILGVDPKLRSLLDDVRRVAPLDATVLIEGESGTGKELVAAALYSLSHRKGLFVPVNCGEIQESLAESTLFGHEIGAFTGATEKRIGLVEEAKDGTLFLDEISELSYASQAKLLRFLESQEFRRVGGNKTEQADVRILAATSKDLRTLCAAGKFQEALYYRLEVIVLHLPALRERPGDIALLTEHFARRFGEKFHKPVTIEPEVLERLTAYPFPGNVRQLEHQVLRLVALSCDGHIRTADLPAEVMLTESSAQPQDPWELLRRRPSTLAELRERRTQLDRWAAEQEHLLTERAIEEAAGNLTEAARRLGVHRATLHRKRKLAQRPR